MQLLKNNINIKTNEMTQAGSAKKTLELNFLNFWHFFSPTKT